MNDCHAEKNKYFMYLCHKISNGQRFWYNYKYLPYASNGPAH